MHYQDCQGYTFERRAPLITPLKSIISMQYLLHLNINPGIVYAAYCKQHRISICTVFCACDHISDFKFTTQIRKLTFGQLSIQKLGQHISWSLTYFYDTLKKRIGEHGRVTIRPQLTMNFGPRSLDLISVWSIESNSDEVKGI